MMRKFPGISDPSIFNGTEFYINPPAYTGFGVGYIPPANGDETDPDFWQQIYTEPRLTDGDDIPFALQLNPNSTSEFGNLLDDFVWQLNVDYTAPDAASPFLNFSDMRFDMTGAFDSGNSVIIPSYHRPALVALYGYAGVDSLRKVVMRPLPFDHPEFDGSQPALALGNLNDLATRLSNTNGLYLDVDTDGDGIKDSVWVDVGLPVRSDANGRTYKPLVAIKCIDLDGKLNVNAHGNLGQLANFLNDYSLGSGFGPAGVNLPRGLSAAFGDGTNTIGSTLAAELFPQRYLGAQEQLTAAEPRHIAIGLTDSVLIQANGFPQTLPLSNYFGSLFDPWDQGILAWNHEMLVDPLGNHYNNFFKDINGALTQLPRYIDVMNSTWKSPEIMFASNPYLFDPNRRTPFDQPFTLPELEAVLRQNDIDKDVLPSRLRNILGFVDPNSGFINEPEVLKVAAYNVTTLSNDVPVPGPALADQGYASLYELIRRCVEKENTRLTSGLTLEQINNITLQLIEYLPEEIRQGGKINLNKLVEDPTMFLSADLAEDFPADYDIALYARMKMARGIYIILMALSYDKLYGVLPDGAGGYVVEPYIEPSFMKATKIAALKSADELEFYRVCRELAATRLAQWAVNVVDFTDVDAIMTPFIFDVNPFDGNAWGNRDPDIGIWNEFTEYDTNKNIAPYNYRLIWGLERPDLLLTETLAFHNRNVADTSSGGYLMQFDQWDSTAATPIGNYHDTTLDQIRKPEGSAFVELLCVADANRATYPQELYDIVSNQLDLGRWVVDADSPTIRRPVWQIAFSKSNVDNKVENSIVHRFKDYGTAFTLQPNNTSVLGPGTPVSDTSMAVDIDLDRFVWPARLDPVAMGVPEAEKIFYNRLADDGVAGTGFYVAPNQYVVIGPRTVTYLTSEERSTANKFGKPGGPKIDLRRYVSPLDYSTDVRNPEFIVPEAYQIGQPRVMIAAANPPDTWTNADNTLWLGHMGQIGYSDNTDIIGIGLNVSEPLRTNYYQEPTQPNDEIKKYDGITSVVDAYSALSDLDTFSTTLQDPLSGSATNPLSNDGIVGTGVVPLYKSVFLQRLADPLRAYHPDTNPYITVDWGMLDLTVYTGEYEGSTYNEFENPADAPTGFQRTMPGLYTEYDNVGTKYISSRQWGVNGPFVSAVPQNSYNQWSRLLDWENFPSDIKTNGSSHNINDTGFVSGIKLDASSNDGTDADGNFLKNVPYQAQVKFKNNMAQTFFPKHTLGRLNTEPDLLIANGVAPASANIIVGDGRPQYLFSGFPNIDTTDIPYYYLGAPIMLTGDETIEPDPSKRAAVKSNVLAPIWHNGPLANSYEVMQVPASSPGRFGVEFADRGNDLDPNDPPYNTNYLLEEMVWDTPPAAGVPGVPNDIEKLPGSLGSNVRFGHLLNFQHAHGSWWPDWFDAHVTAATPTAPPFVSLDLANFLNFVNVPSRFVGTRDWYYDGNKYYSYSRFREPGKVNLNTLTAAGFAALLENRTYYNTPADYEIFDITRAGRPFRGAASSLLNVDAPYESPTGATLLRSQKDAGTDLDTGVPAFAPAVGNAQNTYMALEGVQRLSDMTTTRSNVFAVWLTLGYFEVEKIPIPSTGTYTLASGLTYTFPADRERFNAIYPDGYMLKKEVGLETGEIKRHRAFYILDRSIPFGYRRGQKLNSEDAILLKRFIE
ncbi:MAG: hypothetical protein FWH27_14095 [Planctomycetaceae bacterium]|nr:hypothetical protein [Planctomycetaceae bacterium]